MKRFRWLVSLAIAAACIGRSDGAGYKHAAEAKREFDAVFAHPDNACPWTDNRSYLECMGKEIAFTQGHLEAFVAAMRGIAAESDAGEPPNAGSPRALDAFNKTDMAWRTYRESACRLQISWFRRGTGGPPAAAECELSLDRAYMKMLAGFFNLHELA